MTDIVKLETEVKKLKAELASQSRKQVAKWIIAGATSVTVGIMGLAGIGAWTIFRPQIDAHIQTVANADIKSAVPSGVIAAFTIECPVGLGWQPYKEATGRFIVGAGSEYKRAFKNWKSEKQDGGFDEKSLSLYELESISGEEEHILSEGQLAEHVHWVDSYEGRPPPSEGGVHYYLKGSDTSRPGGDSVGLNEAHNNMPPYIALNFCKKR